MSELESRNSDIELVFKYNIPKNISKTNSSVICCKLENPSTSFHSRSSQLRKGNTCFPSNQNVNPGLIE